VKVTTEALERCETLLTLELEPKKEQAMLQKAAKRIARQVNIPGFRPGKAPYNVVVRRFGLEAVQQEAIEKSVDNLIRDALDEANIVPFARVSLEKIDWSPLTVQVKVPTEPKIEIGNHRDIRLEFEPVEVTDEDVVAVLERIQQQNATWTPVDRPAKIGDMVTVDMVEKDGDEILRKQEALEQVLEDPAEHEGHDHPDMFTPLVGLSAGEEKTFTVTYSEEYHDEKFAGKEITVEVSVGSVKEKEVDPLDDDFAQSFSDFDTLDEFKADIRQGLQEQRQREQNQSLANKAIDKILEDATIEWPAVFEEERIEQELESYAHRMKSYGLSMENYYQFQNKTEEEFKEEIREQVVTQLKRSLVLGKVAELEALKVAESEILERAKLIADYSGSGEQLWRQIITSPVQREMISNDLLTDKTIDLLAAIARGEDPQVETKDAGDEPDAETAQSTETSDAPAETGTENVAEVVAEAEAETETAAETEPIAEADASAEEQG